MKRQFMVRILRDPDEEYADLVVDAEREEEAMDKTRARRDREVAKALKCNEVRP